MTSRIQIAALAVALLATAPAVADSYFSADFTFGVFGGNANQQAPFQGVVAPYPDGGAFTGNLVYDQNQVPGGGSGYQNVYFSSFPAISYIPSTTALNLPLGSLTPFTLGNALTQYGSQNAAIQYDNGAFAGLFYISNFTYGGNPYQLQIQGGSLSIVPIVDGNPGFNSLVNGYVDFSLTNIQPYTPPGPTVPEPSISALMAIGFAVLGFARLRRENRRLPVRSQAAP